MSLEGVDRISESIQKYRQSSKLINIDNIQNVLNDYHLINSVYTKALIKKAQMLHF